MKRLIIAVLVILGVGIVGFQLAGDRLIVGLMKRQAIASMNGDALAGMADGLNVVVCGAGSPLPDPTRAGPCLLVVAGDQVFVVDAGSGSPRNFGPMGINAGAVDAVLLTHFHSDHIDGLGELMLQRWAGGGHDTPLTVHGPTGVERVVAGFNAAYAHDFEYRIAHHGAALVPPGGAGMAARPFVVPDADGHVLIDADGLRITVFPVVHDPVEPAVGYRFDYAGRSVVISGDTAPSATVRAMSQDVDLLVHEAQSAELVAVLTEAAEATGQPNVAQITRDILDYHTTPVQAAEIAEAAGVDSLLLYHIVPPLPVSLMERVFLRGVDDAFAGDARVAHDGLWLHLPADGSSMQAETLMRF